MDKLTAKAFQKMERREHFLQSGRERLGNGRITRDEFRAEEQEIMRRYELTEEERAAYVMYNRITDQRRAKRR